MTPILNWVKDESRVRNEAWVASLTFEVRVTIERVTKMDGSHAGRWFVRTYCGNDHTFEMADRPEWNENDGKLWAENMLFQTLDRFAAAIEIIKQSRNRAEVKKVLLE